MAHPLSRFAPSPSRGTTPSLRGGPGLASLAWAAPVPRYGGGAQRHQRMTIHSFALPALVTLCLAPSWAHAQAVALAGMLGSKALLVVDANPPKAVGAGDEYQGVKVIGTRRVRRRGEAPVGVGARGGSGKRVVLRADSRGHFINSGTINGRVMQYMVDTCASTVAIGLQDAERMGLNYQNGQPVRMNTANGVAQGWRMKLDSVRIGDVEVFGVEAIITPQPMPYVLLGNSFLTEFQMTRINDQMVLEKRN